MPITLKIVASNGELLLKCERCAAGRLQDDAGDLDEHRRADCPPDDVLRSRAGRVSGMNQATVHRKIAIEIRNFIGLTHGLRPRINRMSPIDSNVTTTSASTNSAPIQNSERIAVAQLVDHVGPLDSFVEHALCFRGADREVEQQADRSEHERHHQARNDDEMRDLVALRIAHFPRADEQVERQVVNPAGQQQFLFAKQRRHVGERAEPAVGALEVHRDQRQVARGQNQRDDDAGRDSSGGKFGKENQQEPADHCESGGEGEVLLQGHDGIVRS